MSHMATNSSTAGSVKLKVCRVIGTSATSTANFVCAGGQAAYISGAGVVLHSLPDECGNDDNTEQDELSPTITACMPTESESSRSTSNQSNITMSVSSSANDFEERFFCTVSPDSLASTAGTAIATGLRASTQTGVLSSKRDRFGFLIGVSGKVVRTSFDNSLGLFSGISTGSAQSFIKGIANSPNGLKNKNNSKLNSGVNMVPSFPSEDGARKDRVISPACVALSSCQQLLAVGQSGYQPRIFLYSTASDASTQEPLAMLGAHDIGIQNLAFSPCDRFLASLGVAANGFLHVWDLGALRDTGSVQLLASNRCISDVNDMKWAGNKLYTVGKRHVRAWKLKNYHFNQAGANDDRNRNKIHYSKLDVAEDDGVLVGRNLVLGEFSSCNFVALTRVRSDLLVIATDQGDLATIHDLPLGSKNDGFKIEFMPRLNVGFAITSMNIDFKDEILWTFGPTQKHLR